MEAPRWPSVASAGPSACCFAAALVGVLSYAIWVWATTEPEDPRARRVGPFLATPYLQLGEDPKADDLTLLWHADDVDADWSVEVRSPTRTALEAGRGAV